MTSATDLAARVRTAYRDRFGADPDGVWAAPGRVNLVGEHTDYNDGFVLPVAIDRITVAAVGARRDGLVVGWSAQQGASEARFSAETVPRVTGWLGYVVGLAWTLCRRGAEIRGCNVVVDSDVPVGAGLSSSAALECSVGLALTALAGCSIEPMDLAVAAQQAEREVVGAPVGLMDQAISLLGEPDHALFLDCRSLATEQVPFDPDASGLALLVMDTRVSHSHASGEYGRRRRECAEAAARLGVVSLRDAEPGALAGLDDVLLRRARHVVTENARVAAAVELMRDRSLRELGPILAASHASLRDDFEVSVDQLDVAVEAAMSAGAVGARMTGGGFGGSALALVPALAVGDVAEAVASAFARRGFAQPAVFPVRVGAGARRMEVG